MQTKILTKYLQFKYSLISLSAVDHTIFLSSDKIEQRMLAILGNLGKERLESVLEQLLLDIETLNTGELTKGKYRTQLRVLLDLRNLDKEKLKNMALTGRIFKEENDVLYRRGEMIGEQRGEQKGEIIGEKRGLKRGEHKKALEMARVMKTNGEPTAKIIKYTQLSPQEIENL